MELGHAALVLRGLILIVVANGGPVLFARMLGRRFADPIDGGVVLRDGRPILGRSKTWRGLAAAVVLTACVAVLVGLPWQAGALIGASAMAGDCPRRSSNGDWRSNRAAWRLGSIRFPSRCFLQSLPAFSCRLLLAT